MVLTLKDKAFNLQNNFVIALDGPSASGKGCIGQMLAEQFSLSYFQSSIVYRGLAFLCINEKTNFENISEIIALSKSFALTDYVQNSDLSSEYIGAVASKIAVIPEVRKNLSNHLISLIEITKRIVMEGRDIGTVIAPNADLKIFITADINIRAERRYKQLIKQGKECMMPDVLNQLKIRDLRDQERDVAPLTLTEDSLLIDTSYLTLKQVIERITEFVNLH